MSITLNAHALTTFKQVANHEVLECSTCGQCKEAINFSSSLCNQCEDLASSDIRNLAAA